MPCIIRKVVDDTFESVMELSGEEWKLREQVETLEAWFHENRGRLDPQQEWVADIGFCVRRGASGGGPPITREMMRMCLEANMEIWLSEYQEAT